MTPPAKPPNQKHPSGLAGARPAAGCLLQLAGLALILIFALLGLGAFVAVLNALQAGSLLEPSTWPVIAISGIYLLACPLLFRIGARVFRWGRRLYPAGARWGLPLAGRSETRIRKRHPMLGNVLRFLGWGLTISSALILIFLTYGDPASFLNIEEVLNGLQDRLMTGDLLVDLILVVLVSIVVFAAVFWLLPEANRGGQGLRLVGAKLAAARAEEVMRKDTRPPVLYLRSFSDDKVTAASFEGARPIPVTSADSPERAAQLTRDLWREAFRLPGLPAGPGEEQQIAAVLGEIGPVVAIGNPGERLPELGAARMYVGDEWQQAIKDLVRRARLIVLRAGWTPGLWWEFQHVIQNAPPEKILLLIPYDRQNYEAFSRWAQALFPKPLPAYQGQRRMRRSLTGVVYFDRDWTPHFQELRIPKSWVMSFPAEFKWSLEPVFAQLGLPYRPPRTYRTLSAILSIVLILLFVACLLLALASAIEGLFPGALSF